MSYFKFSITIELKLTIFFLRNAALIFLMMQKKFANYIELETTDIITIIAF